MTHWLPVVIMAPVLWLTAPTTVIVQRDILILTVLQVSNYFMYYTGYGLGVLADQHVLFIFSSLCAILTVQLNIL